ncbi:polysaccharide deacetylase family protein [Rhodomicrobium vannielii ATCC 17100]|uniref:polysaccharide deacetylase family protein n=1 Tax=Rhodomicrobium vannielii TaxID=1069 RepID=UPI001918C718|nr:polysaccharide deacetylase family protein [Rhodomicrobium vannielii]MBJ7533043.1 polysaccharide deacetylase family protein [Rhodomicrobium vannielii ATCC 17100]
MIYRHAAIGLVALLSLAGAARAAECPAGALGTSRTLALDPAKVSRVGGGPDYGTPILDDHEVILTFDDGPTPPWTGKVLEALAAECVHATFFTVGTMARAHPALLKRVLAEGHTIGTHSEHHAHIPKLPYKAASKEISDGFMTAGKSLGDQAAVAPFFRFPYLESTRATETYAAAMGIVIWNIDFHASDWILQTPEVLANRAIDKIEQKKRGILLLHDIHQRTALALPIILQELKKRGYKIVHAVPVPGAHVNFEVAAKIDPWGAKVAPLRSSRAKASPSFDGGAVEDWPAQH